MNREQVVHLLTYAAACDQRTVGEADLVAWHDILAPLDFEACLSAMRQHYRREPDVRLKPGHLWRMVSARTDGEAGERADHGDCEHGRLCGDCDAVHLPHEPCSVLIARPWPRALRAVADLPDTERTA